MREILSLIVLLFSFCVSSQTVETLVNNVSYTMNHGCVVSSDGTIYSTDVVGNGSYNGQYVYKTLPNGSTSIFVSGLWGSAGLAIDQSGNLFVSELNTGKIWKVQPNGIKSLYATGTGVPAGMAFDSNGNLFIANFQFDKIMKVQPNGFVSIFASTDIQPVGIVIDENDNLFVSHESSHKILKITPQGTTIPFADIPNTKLQYLTFLGEDLLVTSYNDHRIYRVSPDGNWSIYAGTGSLGSTDGIVNQASFNTPIGIGLAISENDLFIYIVEKNKIRKITTTSLSTNNYKTTDYQIQIVDNKNNGDLIVNFNKNVSGKLIIYDINGKSLKTLDFENTSIRKIKSYTISSGIYFYKWVSYNDKVVLGGKFIK